MAPQYVLMSFNLESQKKHKSELIELLHNEYDDDGDHNNKKICVASFEAKKGYPVPTKKCLFCIKNETFRGE